MEKAKSTATCGPHNGGEAGGGLVSYLSLGGMRLLKEEVKELLCQGGVGGGGPACFKSDGQLIHYVFLNRTQ